MRLDYLKIDRFQNLIDFAVGFDETGHEPVTVVLGRNGSGKSNLFEALIIIFRDLIKGKTSADFGYDLHYTLRGGTVGVRVCNPRAASDETQGISSQRPFTGKDQKPIDAFSFTVTENGTERRIARKDIRGFLPRYVVTYYSGVSNRMEHHFFGPQLDFRNELLEGNVIPLRPLFYAKPIHSHFALLAFFMTEDPEVTEFLSEYPWIEGLESALFVLKRPHWAKGKKQRKDGDPRFWHAGGVVKDFLSCVYNCALAPLRLPGRIQHSFDQVENTEFLYLYLLSARLGETAENGARICRSDAAEEGSP